MSEVGAYLGPDKLYKVLKHRGVHNIGKYTVRKWLQNQNDYSLQKPVRQTFKRTRVVVSGIDNQFDADIADVFNIAKENDDVKKLLFVLDIFSKYLLVEPLKNKTTKEVVKGLQHIFDKGRTCKK